MTYTYWHRKLPERLRDGAVFEADSLAEAYERSVAIVLHTLHAEGFTDTEADVRSEIEVGEI